MSTDRLIAIISVVLAVVFGLAGLAASWYFYKKSLPTRIPTFLVDSSSRAVLVSGKSSATSDINIQYKGHPIGEEAIYVVRVYFWNAGNTPIYKGEILKALKLTTSPRSEILDAKILKVSRDVTKFAVQVEEDKGAAQEDKQQTASINFDILEPFDGAALQITYATPIDWEAKTAKLKIQGATVGAPEVNEIEVTDYPQELFTRLSPFEEVLSRYRHGISYLFLGLALALTSSMSISVVRNSIYLNLFKTRKTTQEIEVSASRVMFWAIAILFPVGFSLIVMFPPAVPEFVPPALIVND